MTMCKQLISTALGLFLFASFMMSSGLAQAADGVPKHLKQEWSFQGIFGTYDRGEVRRGSQIFFEICNGCHSLDMVSYRNLVEVGLDLDFVTGLASEYEVQDGPNDEGDMFMRPARLSDRVVAPFENEKASRFANGGSYPPDLSVITKARVGGPDSLYALLVSYEDPPEGFELGEGLYYNEYFHGHKIFMAPPLDDEAVEYDDGTPMTLHQHARDITSFLSWAAEPELEERKSLGIKVMLYLIVITILLYLLKRRIWNRIHLAEHTHGPYEEEYRADLDRYKNPG